MNRNIKVGIITFHASLNCGSMLQAYALQKIIKGIIGLENELINFSNEGQKKIYSIFYEIKSLRNLIGNMLRLVFYPILASQKKHYQAFLSNYLVIAPEFFTTNDELKAINGKYESFICGSDQVWNNQAVDGDDAYFLKFVTKGRKIAYATSLGATNIICTDISEKYYRELLSDFYAVSVRERNAKQLIEKIYDKDVEVLLDPTLLLKKEEWELLIKEPLYKFQYIFYYAFNYSDEVNYFVKKIARKYNLAVIMIDATAWGPKRIFTTGFKLSKEFGPLAFLNLMKYATLVLTTSFHGTAFSVIMEKKFWFIDSNMHHKDDDRANSLLAQVCLETRFCKGETLINQDLFEEINYKVVKDNIKSLQEKSIKFLMNSLIIDVV